MGKGDVHAHFGKKISSLPGCMYLADVHEFRVHRSGSCVSWDDCALSAFVCFVDSEGARAGEAEERCSTEGGSCSRGGVHPEALPAGAISVRPYIQPAVWKKKFVPTDTLVSSARTSSLKVGILRDVDSLCVLYECHTGRLHILALTSCQACWTARHLLICWLKVQMRHL